MPRPLPWGFGQGTCTSGDIRRRLETCDERRIKKTTGVDVHVIRSCWAHAGTHAENKGTGAAIVCFIRCATEARIPGFASDHSRPRAGIRPAPGVRRSRTSPCRPRSSPVPPARIPPAAQQTLRAVPRRTRTAQPAPCTARRASMAARSPSAIGACMALPAVPHGHDATWPHRAPRVLPLPLRSVEAILPAAAAPCRIGQTGHTSGAPRAGIRMSLPHLVQENTA